MNNLAKKIIKDSFTKQEALRGLSELKMAAEANFFGKGEILSGQSDLLKGVNKDNFEEVFRSVEAEINRMSELTVYLTFEPGVKEIAKLGKKSRELFGQDLFLSFKLDSELLGGAALAFGGVYRDYSLRARFEEKKEELREVYSKLLR